MLFNNRVGSGGPLFSGVIIFSLISLVYISFKLKTQKQRYAFYVSVVCLTFIIILSLLPPTPNLLRYVSQLQLIPFVVIIPLYLYVKNNFIKIALWITLLLVFVNNSLFLVYVAKHTINQTNKINSQLSSIKSKDVTYKVRAQHFYSNYILLAENNIKFISYDELPCKNYNVLVASSTTTQYCLD